MGDDVTVLESDAMAATSESATFTAFEQISAEPLVLDVSATGYMEVVNSTVSRIVRRDIDYRRRTLEPGASRLSHQ
jgi:hypothetical protein